MLRATLAITLLLGFVGLGSAAPRVLGHVEGSYELRLSDVRMPSNAAGTVTLRTCANCQSVTRQVDGNTRYYLGEQALPLADFLSVVQGMLASASANDGVLVMVYYHLETTNVTRIVLHDHRG